MVCVALVINTVWRFFLYNLADLEINNDAELGSAEDALNEALEICQKNRLTILIPKVLRSLGKLAHARRDLAEAETKLSEALQIFLENGNAEGAAGARIYLAATFLDKGDLEQAVIHLLAAFTASVALQIDFLKASALSVMVDLYLCQNKSGDAARLCSAITSSRAASIQQKRQAQTRLNDLSRKIDLQKVCGRGPNHENERVLDNLVNESIGHLKFVT